MCPKTRMRQGRPHTASIKLQAPEPWSERNCRIFASLASRACAGALAATLQALSIGFNSQVKDIDNFRIKILTALILLRSLNADNVSGQPFFGEAETNELFELLDPGRAADLIVVPVESETYGQVPAEPNAGHHRACHTRD